MTKRKDLLAVVTLLLLCVTAIPGIMSIDFSHAISFLNQYGQSVSIYGYGIYAFDSYFKAPISIGTDFCILFVLVPMFLYTYIQYRKSNDSLAELKMISVYSVALYYAASIVFGVTYNRLFIAYVVLFSCSIFGMFMHIKKIKWSQTIQVTKGLIVFLILSGIALFAAWLPDIIPTLLNGGTLPLIEVYTTEITYVLDMGIIGPLCFVCLHLLVKKQSLGTMLLAILLKACIVVGIMMIPQTILQVVSGAEIQMPVLVSKSLSFVALGGFALFFNIKMYKELSNEITEEK
ncbi:hypothetical protein [Ruminiclostridium papyrosolvens]|uniref:Uncharacterized protein n=1 Tax=Ruminiclostridium papyrosolvens C7 TaxID=1330534 RepID=U4R4Q3_9FIRM|nr:hypothetical protein [Ruminiclostridium papyrosolvens]EPR13494.1 hypothetical protein L323_06020 [Ruminiclostridium papyrosolvens C7]